MSGMAFPSTGDPAEDARIAAQIRRTDGLLSEGLCPNVCGPLVHTDPVTRHCPRCGFTHQQRTWVAEE